MCKINPRIDFAFKKLFGSEQNKDLLISLINSIVLPKDRIKSVELRNPYNFAEYTRDKSSILDIKAQDERGNWINIEMQVAKDLNFDKRAIYYWAKMVTDQLSEGMMFKELSKTISINILDFNFITGEPDFHTRFKILNDKAGKDYNLHDMFELHYIELKKFRKDYAEIANTLDRWVTFLTKANKLDRKNLPKELSNDREIVKAFDEVNRLFNEDERKIYTIHLHEQMNFESELDSAFEEGLEKGLEKGIEKGIKKGIEQGIEQGIEKGRIEEKLQLAKGLLDILDIETISKKTGLTIEEIEKLK